MEKVFSTSHIEKLIINDIIRLTKSFAMLNYMPDMALEPILQQGNNVLPLLTTEEFMFIGLELGSRVKDGRLVSKASLYMFKNEFVQERRFSALKIKDVYIITSILRDCGFENIKNELSIQWLV